jgi:hypothetical protein
MKVQVLPDPIRQAARRVPGGVRPRTGRPGGGPPGQLVLRAAQPRQPGDLRRQRPAAGTARQNIIIITTVGRPPQITTAPRSSVHATAIFRHDRMPFSRQ